MHKKSGNLEGNSASQPGSSRTDTSSSIGTAPLAVGESSVTQRASGGSTSSALSDNQDPSSPRTKVSTTTATSAATSGRSSGNAGQLEERKRSQQLLGPDVFFRKFRQIVSQNGRRYQNDGYDLDLTYITDRIIAMGYPASDRESVYRSSMEQTVISRASPSRPLQSLQPVHNYLQEDKRNIVAVHCKAGKGRTGVMICAYLVYIGFYLSPRQNMDYYSVVRTMNNKGVYHPSQRRYVYYFAHLRKFHLNYIPLRVELVGVYVERPPRISGSLTKGDFSLRVLTVTLMCITGIAGRKRDKKWGNPTRCSRGPDSYDPCNPVRGNDVISRRAYGWTVPSNKRVFLEGDVRMDLYHSKKVKLLNVGSKDRSKLDTSGGTRCLLVRSFAVASINMASEAFPYPPGETTIASRVLATNPPPPPPQQGVRPKSGSASVPNSPPLSPKTERSSTATRAPSFDARKNKASSANRLHNAVKKLAEGVVSRNSEPNIDRPSSSGKRDGSGSDPTRRGDGSSFDIHLISPPGQDLHYGTPVEKAPDGRPGTSTGFGPFCITRKRRNTCKSTTCWKSTVLIKKKDIDPGFRLIVVTRDEEQWRRRSLQDPLQKKYFYRQRIDSFSRYLSATTGVT
ncbi:unnamed protein product, partial [Mesorhabditis spiculigera]